MNKYILRCAPIAAEVQLTNFQKPQRLGKLVLWIERADGEKVLTPRRRERKLWAAKLWGRASELLD